MAVSALLTTTAQAAIYNIEGIGPVGAESFATGINDQGQIIGTGLLHGTTNTAFLMTLSGAVPEPGTWALMSLGLIGVAGMVRRRAKLRA
jgi:hypothetical protein